MMAVTGRAMWIKPMLITSDLKRRLNSKFFAHLVSQLSSWKAAPSKSRTRRKKQTVTTLKANTEANVGCFGRMQMAALQT